MYTMKSPYRFHNGIRLNATEPYGLGYLDPYALILEPEGLTTTYSDEYLETLMDDNTKSLLWIARDLYKSANCEHNEPMLHAASYLLDMLFDDGKFTVKMSCFDQQRPSQELKIELTIDHGEMVEQKTSRSCWEFLSGTFDGLYLRNIHSLEVIPE